MTVEIRPCVLKLAAGISPLGAYGKAGGRRAGANERGLDMKGKLLGGQAMQGRGSRCV